MLILSPGCIDGACLQGDRWGCSCFTEGNTKYQQLISLDLVNFPREKSSDLPPRGHKLGYHHSGCQASNVSEAFASSR